MNTDTDTDDLTERPITPKEVGVLCRFYRRVYLIASKNGRSAHECDLQGREAARYLLAFAEKSSRIHLCFPAEAE